MGRVSLTEDYDDRSVISKLNEMDKRVKENTTVVTSAEASAKASAQAAQETADRFAGSVGAVVQNANAQINASKAQVDQAKAEVDETVTTVAQAVQTANQASASAQQSANTVATYDTRLTAVEDADAQNVKLNGAQTINGEKTFNNIVIPTSTGNYNGGMVFKVPDSLSTTDIITAKNRTNASVLNCRLLKDSSSTLLMTALRTPSNQQKYTVYQVNDDGTQVFRGPGPYKGAPSDSYVTKGYVESTDGVTNNLVHKTSAETINGEKTFADGIIAYRAGWHTVLTNQTAGQYVHFATYRGSYGWNALVEFVSSSNNGIEYGLLGLSNGGDAEPDANNATWFVRGCGAGGNKVLFNKDLYICHNPGSDEWHLVMHKRDPYGNIVYNVKIENGYGNQTAPESRLVYVTPTVVDISSYTHKYKVSDANVGSE